MVLICKTLGPLHPRMLCVRFSWNWPSGSGEEDFELVNMFSLSRYYLSLAKGMTLHGPLSSQTWISFTQECYVLSLVEICPVNLEKKGWEVYRQTDRLPEQGFLFNINHTVKMLNLFSTAEQARHRSNKLTKVSNYINTEPGRVYQNCTFITPRAWFLVVGRDHISGNAWFLLNSSFILMNMDQTK